MTDQPTDPLRVVLADDSGIFRQGLRLLLETLGVTVAADVADADAIAAHFTKLLGRPVRPVARRNDALLAGFRVRVGDDVTDVSASLRLANLAKSLS